jgi:glyoxylase I family protein
MQNCRPGPNVLHSAKCWRQQRGSGNLCDMVEGVDRPKPSGVDHVGLSVTDLDRSISFYRDELGALLVVPPFEGYRGFSGRMAIVLLGMTIVDLYEHEANRGERFEPSRTGLDHLALAAESHEELDSWAGWLDSRGIPRSDVRDSDGFGALFDFVDPDGIQIEMSYLDRDMLRQASIALTERRDGKTV